MKKYDVDVSFDYAALNIHWYQLMQHVYILLLYCMVANGTKWQQYIMVMVCHGTLQLESVATPRSAPSCIRGQAWPRSTCWGRDSQEVQTLPTTPGPWKGPAAPTSNWTVPVAEAQRSVAATWSILKPCELSMCRCWISCQCDFKLNTSFASQHLRKLLIEYAHSVFSLQGTGRKLSAVWCSIQSSELQNPRNRRGQWSSPRDA